MHSWNLSGIVLCKAVWSKSLTQLVKYCRTQVDMDDRSIEWETHVVRPLLFVLLTSAWKQGKRKSLCFFNHNLLREFQCKLAIAPRTPWFLIVNARGSKPYGRKSLQIKANPVLSQARLPCLQSRWQISSETIDETKHINFSGSTIQSLWRMLKAYLFIQQQESETLKTWTHLHPCWLCKSSVLLNTFVNFAP